MVRVVADLETRGSSGAGSTIPVSSSNRLHCRLTKRRLGWRRGTNGAMRAGRSHRGRSRRSIRRCPEGFRRFSTAWASPIQPGSVPQRMFRYSTSSRRPRRRALIARSPWSRRLALRLAVGPVSSSRCGTAITVERISEQGIWQGGAIAPGLRVVAGALHNQTAMLPLVELHACRPVGDIDAAGGRGRSLLGHSRRGARTPRSPKG